MSSASLRIAICCLLPALLLEVRAQPYPEYGIKEDQPRTGSRIRQNAVGPTRIAVNLPYERLSPEDKAQLHDYYEHIADGDEPPFPRHGLRAVLDPIRQAQAKLLAEGNLFLIVTVGPDGKAKEVKAIGSPSPEMTRFAAQVLVLTPYKPALCSGQPCAMDFPLRMTFRVR